MLVQGQEEEQGGAWDCLFEAVWSALERVWWAKLQEALAELCQDLVQLVEPQNSLKTNYQTPPENSSSAPDNGPVCYSVMA